MHNSTNGISNEVIQKLNKPASKHLSNKFREVFYKLTPDQKKCYLHTTIENHCIRAMYCILSSMEEDEAIKIFNDLLQKNNDLLQKNNDLLQKNNDLLQKNNDLLQKNNILLQKNNILLQKNNILLQKNNILLQKNNDLLQKNNDLLQKNNDLFQKNNDLLQENEEFTFNILDFTAYRSFFLFTTLFSQLNSQQKEDYKIHLEIKPKVSTKRILKRFYSNDKSNESLAQKRVIKELNELAHKGQINLFRETFNDLSCHHKKCYLHTTIEKRCAKAMYYILSSMEEQEAIDTFNYLLQKDKDFAFNTLDVVVHRSTLFRTLFNQLNSQQKKGYKKHLEIKQTGGNKHILEDFYSADSDEFSEVKGTFFTHSVTLQGLVGEYLDPEDVVPESTLADNCVVNLDDILSELEKQPPGEDQLCNELLFWMDGGQPPTSLQFSTLKKFNELEKIIIEPAKRQRILQQ